MFGLSFHKIKRKRDVNPIFPGLLHAVDVVRQNIQQDYWARLSTRTYDAHAYILIPRILDILRPNRYPSCRRAPGSCPGTLRAQLAPMRQTILPLFGPEHCYRAGTRGAAKVDESWPLPLQSHQAEGAALQGPAKARRAVSAIS